MPRGTTQQRQALINQIIKDHGDGAAHPGDYTRTAPSIPTGCIALDYALGTGGWPRGCMIGIYGPRDIGKSVLALHGLANAQKMGLGCAYIAYEQKWDPEWVKQFGVIEEEVVVSRPDTAESAFDILYKLCENDIIDFIVFDSIGAVLTESEVYGKSGKDGTTGDAKAKMGGQAGAITHGVKRIPAVMWKGQKTIIMLNQVRDVMSATVKGYKQPGGAALEHAEEIIIQLKNGGQRFAMKQPGGSGDDKIEYGQEVAAVILRNQRSQGSRKTARYDFYNMAVEGHKIGIDRVTDVINTATRSGVAKAGNQGWFTVDGIDKKFQKGAFATYLETNPSELDRIRELVLEKAHGKTGDNEVPVN